MAKRLAVGVVVAASAFASAQNAIIDELVGGGVFGVSWTDSRADVRAVHRSESGVVTYWTIRDGRTVFDVERRRRDTVQFAFVEDKLGAVFIMSPACDEIAGTLMSVLGPMTAESGPWRPGVPRALNYGRWTGASFKVATLGRECMLTITRVGNQSFSN